MLDFQSMLEVLPEGQVGETSLSHFEVSEADVKFAEMRVMVTGCADEYVFPGQYVRLQSGGKVWMTDTHFERRTNFDFLLKAERAGGDILVAGLGLGMIVLPVAKLQQVKSITVIEKNPDVVELVQPALMQANKHVKKKLSITVADIFEWQLERGAKWDVIYFDIWPDSNVDNLDEISKLKKKFARRLNKDNPRAWMGAWQEAHFRYLRRCGRWR